MRGETNGVVVQPHVVDISIHSPHARGDGERLPHAKQGGNISIHSPHARGDLTHGPSYLAVVPISIHSPHARGDAIQGIRRPARTSTFQSTPLMRGETFWLNRCGSRFSNFNPLPSCEGRLETRCQQGFCAHPISIHSPHARGDAGSSTQEGETYHKFQSTPLMRGETVTGQSNL